MIRRVITDRDVLAGGVGSPIVLDEHTLLTPAARDRAMQKGLVIVERGAPLLPDSRSASARVIAGAAGDTAQPTPSLGNLPDGLHLVRVEGGRVVSTLPAAGAGILQPARGITRP